MGRRDDNENNNDDDTTRQPTPKSDTKTLKRVKNRAEEVEFGIKEQFHVTTDPEESDNDEVFCEIQHTHSSSTKDHLGHRRSSLRRAEAPDEKKAGERLTSKKL